MATFIQRFDAPFAALNTPFTLTVPVGSAEDAIWVYPEEQKLSFFAEVTDPAAPTYVRTFMLIATGQDITSLAAGLTYKKYMASFPLGGVEVYLIEVTQATA